MSIITNNVATVKKKRKQLRTAKRLLWASGRLPTMDEFIHLNPLPPNLAHLEPLLRTVTPMRLFEILDEVLVEEAAASRGLDVKGVSPVANSGSSGICGGIERSETLDRRQSKQNGQNPKANAFGDDRQSSVFNGRAAR